MTRIHKSLGGLLLLVLLLSAGPVLASPPAQNVTRIRYGDTVQGTITDAAYFVAYDFEGRAGEVVTIEMTATGGNLDTFVILVDQAGELLISNDDIDASNYNSRIEAFSLPVDGLYSIGATRYDVETGTSIGNFSLTLTLVSSGSDPAPTVDVPTATPPDLGIVYEQIVYGDNVSGEINAEFASRFYIFFGQQGDLVSATVTPGSGLLPTVRFFDVEFNEVSHGVLDQTTGDTRAFIAVPTAGWYLVEVAGQSGGGTYSLFLLGFPGFLVDYGAALSGQVTADLPSSWYVFQARHGDAVTAEMTATGGDLAPFILLGDVNLNDLASSSLSGNVANLSYTIPREGTYVLLAGREGLAEGSTTGSFNLNINGVALNPSILNAPSLGYGVAVEGSVSDSAPVAYYAFQGKSGDLITVSMSAADANALDPYLILVDADMNELTFSDNTGISNNARIFQYALPENSVYYILATRPDQALGREAGEFVLELTVGEVELTSGAVAVTLRWNNTGDVDLFVSDPNGDIVGFDNREVPSGGILEVDTNSNCNSLTPLPVEHIYWPEGTDLPGTYRIAVIYQLDCENRGPVTFDLSVTVGGQEIATESEQLERGQRYSMTVTVNENGSAINNNDSVIDTVGEEARTQVETMLYGQAVNGIIDDSQTTSTYEFSGEAGDAILITADRVSGDLDPMVGLFDDTSELVAQDDDSGGNHNARLQFTLPESGAYRIIVTRYDLAQGTTSGEFRMALSRVN